MQVAATPADEEARQRGAHASTQLDDSCLARYAKFMTNHPGSCACLSFIIMGVLSALSLSALAGTSASPFAGVELSQFYPALDNHDSATVRGWRAFEKASQSRSGANDAADGNTTITTTTTILYDAHPGGNLFSADGIEAMAGFERALLGTPRYHDNCERVESSTNDGTFECKSPLTLLNYLYRNDSVHESQCRLGFCNAPTAAVALCGTVALADWGTAPCTSKVYDWRDGVLADEQDWPELIHDQVCSSDTLKEILLDSDAVCKPKSVSTRYTVSRYSLETMEDDWPTFEATEAGSSFAAGMVTALSEALIAYSATGLRDYRMATSMVDGKAISIVYDSIFFKLFGNYAAPDLTLAGYSAG
jgi:hypothetical protein